MAHASVNHGVGFVITIVLAAACAARPLKIPDDGENRDLASVNLIVVDLGSTDLARRDAKPAALDAAIGPTGDGGSTGGLGDPCTISTSESQATKPAGTCSPGMYCIPESAGPPGGYCTEDCGEDYACPIGSVCLGSAGGCAVTCTSNQDCREGWVCDYAQAADASICRAK